MLGRDVLVLEPRHLVEGGHEDLAQSCAWGRLAAADLLGAAFEHRLEARGERLGLDLHPPQEGGDQTVVLVEQGEQEVFGLDGGVLEAGSRRLGGLEGLLGTFGESIKAHVLWIPRRSPRQPPGHGAAAQHDARGVGAAPSGRQTAGSG